MSNVDYRRLVNLIDQIKQYYYNIFCMWTLFRYMQVWCMVISYMCTCINETNLFYHPFKIALSQNKYIKITLYIYMLLGFFLSCHVLNNTQISKSNISLKIIILLSYHDYTLYMIIVHVLFLFASSCTLLWKNLV